MDINLPLLTSSIALGLGIICYLKIDNKNIILRKFLMMFFSFLIIGCFLTPFVDSFILGIMNEILIFGVLAMSLDILMGYTGLASLGHAAYFGISSYACAIVMTKSSWVTSFAAYTWAQNNGLGIIFLLVVAIIVALIFAAFFGLLAIRATDVYFLMITLSIAMVVWGLAYRWSAVTEGDNGINIPGRPSLFGLNLADDSNFYFFSLAIFLISFSIMYLFVNSPFGKTLVGIRESEERMKMLGYNTWLHKYIAFIAAGIFSGIAGFLWALFNLFISPPDLELITSAEALFMVALGGPATLLGPVIGAGIIKVLQQFVSIYVERWPLILGAIYILTIMISRLYKVEGILGLVNKIRGSSEASKE